jgi:hypothetical protein
MRRFLPEAARLSSVLDELSGIVRGPRHCEEHRDEAIHEQAQANALSFAVKAHSAFVVDCFTPLCGVRNDEAGQVSGSQFMR